MGVVQERLGRITVLRDMGAALSKLVSTVLRVQVNAVLYLP